MRQSLKAASRLTEPSEEPMTIMDSGIVAPDIVEASCLSTSGTGGLKMNISMATSVAMSGTLKISLSLMPFVSPPLLSRHTP